ncbi:MAG: GFA family protein, partial [Solirubrobacteraceae bacterium]
MATREAACSCGQLTVQVSGDPVRVSVCHCLACQRRTGSAFGYQARWPVGSARSPIRASRSRACLY